MKVRKKILSLVGIIVIMALFVTSCGSNNDKEKEALSNESSKKKITLVTSGAGEPFSLLDDNMKWTGIDADIWGEIGKRTGWEIEVKRSPFESCFGELDAGRADLTSNCWAIKEERTEKYNSSIPYYGDAQCVAVRKGSTEIKEIKDLKGKKVGVMTGHASETILQEMSKDMGFELITYEDTPTGLKQLALERIDAMGCAVTSVTSYCKETGEELDILNEKLLPVNVGFFFPKTENGEKLRDETNAVIKEMLADGTIAKITEKWLFDDMTKYIIEDKK